MIKICDCYVINWIMFVKNKIKVDRKIVSLVTLNVMYV